MSDTLKALKMRHDWLFVRPIEEVVGGKIIIPDSAKEITQKGEIVALGEKCSDSNLKMNDEILFRRRAAFKVIEIDGVRLNVMKPDSVLAVMFGEEVTAVTPLKDNVFLEWEFKTQYYHGTSIVIPGTHQEMHYTGIVVAIGPDVKEVVIGDRVFFDQFASAGVEKFQEDGKRYAFVKAGDIYCSGVPMRDEVKLNMKPGQIIWIDNPNGDIAIPHCEVGAVPNEVGA